MGTLKIGLTLWSLGETPDLASLRAQFEIAARVGCKSVQPWCVDYGKDKPCILDPDRADKNVRSEVRKMADDLGLSFSGFCAQLMGAKTFGGLEEEEGLAERVEKTKKSMTLAAELGGPVVTTHIGLMPEDTTAPAYQTLLKSCGEIARHSETVGAVFAMETGQEPPDVLLKFIDTLGSPGLGINYDPCNLLRFGSREGTIDGVKLLGKHIVHTHGKDWNPDTKRATCGLGGVPWKEYIDALKDVGYTGWFAIEDETGTGSIEASIQESFDFLAQF